MLEDIARFKLLLVELFSRFVVKKHTQRLKTIIRFYDYTFLG